MATERRRRTWPTSLEKYVYNCEYLGSTYGTRVLEYACAVSMMYFSARGQSGIQPCRQCTPVPATVCSLFTLVLLLSARGGAPARHCPAKTSATKLVREELGEQAAARTSTWHAPGRQTPWQTRQFMSSENGCRGPPGIYSQTARAMQMHPALSCLRRLLLGPRGAHSACCLQKIVFGVKYGTMVQYDIVSQARPK